MDMQLLEFVDELNWSFWHDNISSINDIFVSILSLDLELKKNADVENLSMKMDNIKEVGEQIRKELVAKSIFLPQARLYKIRSFNIATLIEKSKRLFASQFKENQIRFTIQKTVSPEISGIERMFEIAITNLLFCRMYAFGRMDGHNKRMHVELCANKTFFSIKYKDNCNMNPEMLQQLSDSPPYIMPFIINKYFSGSTEHFFENEKGLKIEMCINS
jgi:hypothetical protein